MTAHVLAAVDAVLVVDGHACRCGLGLALVPGATGVGGLDGHRFDAGFRSRSK